MNDKKCRKCGEWKTYDDFHKDKKFKDGHKARCKICIKAYSQDNKERIAEQRREYRRNNKDRLAEMNRKWREANPETNSKWTEANLELTREYKRKWRENNPEYHRQYSKTFRQENHRYDLEEKRKWREANPGYHAEKSREYRQANPAKIRANCAQRRALKKSTTTTDTWELSEILLFYKHCPDGFHIDHIIPLKLGGTHTLDNLQYLEAKLNMSKSDKHPDDWDDPRPIKCRA